MAEEHDDEVDEAPDADGKSVFGMSRTDSIEMSRQIVAAFGGPAEFAARAKEVYDDAPEGSHVRSQIFKTCLGLVEEASRIQERRGDDNFDQMSDEQVQEYADRVVRHAILENPAKWLPVLKRAVASLGDQATRQQVFDEINQLEAQLS